MAYALDKEITLKLASLNYQSAISISTTVEHVHRAASLSTYFNDCICEPTLNSALLTYWVPFPARASGLTYVKRRRPYLFKGENPFDFNDFVRLIRTLLTGLLNKLEYEEIFICHLATCFGIPSLITSRLGNYLSVNAAPHALFHLWKLGYSEQHDSKLLTAYMHKCTQWTHQDIVNAIVSKGPSATSALMKEALALHTKRRALYLRKNASHIVSDSCAMCDAYLGQALLAGPAAQAALSPCCHFLICTDCHDKTFTKPNTCPLCVSFSDKRHEARTSSLELFSEESWKAKQSARIKTEKKEPRSPHPSRRPKNKNQTERDLDGPPRRHSFSPRTNPNARPSTHAASNKRLSVWEGPISFSLINEQTKCASITSMETDGQTNGCNSTVKIDNTAL